MWKGKTDEKQKMLKRQQKRHVRMLDVNVHQQINYKNLPTIELKIGLNFYFISPFFKKNKIK
jgi:hypothetical protein